MHAFRLGKVLGIDVRLDWSWVFILVLMVWNLCALFGRWHPEWPAVEQFAVAAVAALLFFGCVLLHELAHSAVAMQFGLSVRSITLFLFGGVSNIEHEPPSAAAEFWTAIVGPVTSIGLGIIFLGLGAVTTSVSMHDAASLQATCPRSAPSARCSSGLDRSTSSSASSTSFRPSPSTAAACCGRSCGGGPGGSSGRRSGRRPWGRGSAGCSSCSASR